MSVQLSLLDNPQFFAAGLEPAAENIQVDSRLVIDSVGSVQVKEGSEAFLNPCKNCELKGFCSSDECGMYLMELDTNEAEPYPYSFYDPFLSIEENTREWFELSDEEMEAWL